MSLANLLDARSSDIMTVELPGRKTLIRVGMEFVHLLSYVETCVRSGGTAIRSDIQQNWGQGDDARLDTLVGADCLRITNPGGMLSDQFELTDTGRLILSQRPMAMA